MGFSGDSESDTFSIQIKEKEPVCTKRGVLSLMSSVYDPLGLVGPCILRAKMIFQDECRRGKGWDEPLSEDNKQRWLNWLRDLSELRHFKIERCLLPSNPDQVVEIELHHFCDASETAYGAVSYLRVVDKGGHVKCSIIQAKSRLAPLKGQTIPRLELLGAVVAVKLDTSLRAELQLDVARSVFWTDST